MLSVVCVAATGAAVGLGWIVIAMSMWTAMLSLPPARNDVHLNFASQLFSKG